ncbi:unnamed protein product [Orchesella dallaii]|uniref:Uncharacterized protein n=1 Tax=Orchesella dallaii TaxID=48710 RepID=A0ABP1PZP4_9HEXA
MSSINMLFVFLPPAFNHINLPTPTSKDGSYILEPFVEHPIILSFHRFKKVTEPIRRNDFNLNSNEMYCDDDRMELQPNQQFKFRAPPSPKANCFVQFYIDPAPCTYWRFRSPSYFNANSKPFDSMYQEAGFDYRSEDKSTEFMSDYNLANTGLFFIHVMKTRGSGPYGYEVLFKVDYGWQQADFFTAWNFIQPTKFVLMIAKEDGDHPYIPVRGGMLGCYNYGEWWKRLEEECKQQSSSSHSLRVWCLSMSLEIVAKVPSVLEPGGDHIKTWKQLEDAATKSES